MSTSAWLIEIAPPIGDVLYYCGPGDWCSNPIHAYKFHLKANAEAVLAKMQNPQSMRIAEHEWCDPLSVTQQSVSIENKQR